MESCQEAAERLDELLCKIAQAMSIQNANVRVARLEAIQAEAEQFKKQLLPPSTGLCGLLAVSQSPQDSA